MKRPELQKIQHANDGLKPENNSNKTQFLEEMIIAY